MLNLRKLTKKINHWGEQRKPFLLMIDFEMKETLASPLDELDTDEVLFNFRGTSNRNKVSDKILTPLEWLPTYVDESSYQNAFSQVQKGLHRGDSYLTNLTFPTSISTNWSLKDIYECTEAPYRIYWKNRFTCFSPETFVQIKNGRIYSFPMKGTLPAHLPNNILLENPKEKAEHATIVDLIRNDLSIVADKVQVDRYRYIDRIATNNGDLWQSSSQISGDLPLDFHKNLGDTIMKLLPAGSISGAPKRQTLSLIEQAEPHKRGFYTGVAFLWDGYSLDSCVLIRFIEKVGNKLKYWSGGGVTVYSNWEEEYKELKEKVYLPNERKKRLATAIDLY